jgi:serine/threonine protein kinase
VAIKVLPERYLADGDFRVRFEREAQVVAALEHPAIVPLYDFGEDLAAHLLYYVMRLMPGGSLVERIDRGPFSLAEAARMIGRIAPALDEAHVRGVVHRDLKPGNILFDQRDDAYIADFGIAKQIGVGATSTGSIIGTPAYMSPEQARGERELTGRSDLYALGVILYEMLTGRAPFQADTPVAIALKHITEPPPRLARSRPDLPGDCQLMLDQAMAKDPNARYPTATALASALSAVARGERIERLPPAQSDQFATLGGKPAPTQRQRLPAARPVRPAAKRLPLVWLFAGAGLLAGIAALAVLAVLFLPDLANLVGSSATVTPDVTSLALAAQISATHSAETQTAGASSETATASGSSAPATPAVQLTQAASINSTQLAGLSTTSTAIAQIQTTIDAASAATAAGDATRTAAATAAVQGTAVVLSQLSAVKIAFLKDNDIWLVNVDGSALTQLTTDGGAKWNLRWLPDRVSIAYISGRCIQAINFQTKTISGLGCFNSSQLVEGFEVSPGGQYFAASVDRITYVGQWQPEQLAPITNYTQLRALASCLTFSVSATQYLRWSADAGRLALMVIGVSTDGLASDTIQLIRFKCDQSPAPLNYDQFPGTRFSLPKFSQTRKFQNFGWDGRDLFALIDYVRNDGFGNMYIYNTATKRSPIQLDPLQGCCYRDPMWSIDGSSFVFVFQDRNLGAVSKIELYYAPYNTLVSGGRLAPVPLPDNFFTSATDKPVPVVSP